ncbi:MAG TPA: hypothetical protein QGF58_28445 [Myxococcota bacterium]|nr:hypothetical protein [Myxococcota bacterium]
MTEANCVQCQRLLHADEARHAVDAGLLCANCYTALRDEVERQLGEIQSGINYPLAFIAHGFGAGIGAALYVASIVLSGWDIAIVAIAMPWIGTKLHQKAIGFKRSTGLVIMAVGISLPLFAVTRLLMWGGDMSMFDPLDLLWVGIIAYEAWRQNKPLR